MWKVVKKGYKVDLDRIYCGHEYGDIFCQAEDLNQAKCLLMKQNVDKSLYLETLADIPVTYQTIPVILCEDYDLVEFDGKEMSRESANMLQKYLDKQVENDKILNDSSVKYVFIKKGGWYYRENYCGYTEHELQAGVYTKEDGYKHCGNILELRMIPINIEQYNNLIQKQVDKLLTQILK